MCTCIAFIVDIKKVHVSEEKKLRKSSVYMLSRRNTHKKKQKKQSCSPFIGDGKRCVCRTGEGDGSEGKDHLKGFQIICDRYFLFIFSYIFLFSRLFISCPRHLVSYLPPYSNFFKLFKNTFC